MGRIESVRNDFISKFDMSDMNRSVSGIKEWFKPAFPEDNLIISWKCEDLKKVMRIQEADEDEPLAFDFFTAKAGENDEYDDLFIQAISINEMKK